MTIAELIAAGPHDECEWAAGDVVTQQGESCDSLYVVVEGTLDVWSEEADQSSAVATLEAGAVFGEVTLLDPGPATATVRAVGAARGLRLRHEVLERLWDEAPEKAREVHVRLVKTLAGRLREATCDIEGKVAPPSGEGG